MKQASNDNQINQGLRSICHAWLYNPVASKRGENFLAEYFLADPDGHKVAVIVAQDINRPIKSPEPNARLLLRESKSADWQSFGASTLTEAMDRGNRHFDRWLLRRRDEQIRAHRSWQHDRGREDDCDHET